MTEKVTTEFRMIMIVKVMILMARRIIKVTRIITIMIISMLMNLQ